MREVLNSVQTRQNEREWIRFQSAGDFDDGRIVDGATGTLWLLQTYNTVFMDSIRWRFSFQKARNSWKTTWAAPSHATNPQNHRGLFRIYVSIQFDGYAPAARIGCSGHASWESSWAWSSTMGCFLFLSVLTPSAVCVELERALRWLARHSACTIQQISSKCCRQVWDHCVLCFKWLLFPADTPEG